MILVFAGTSDARAYIAELAENGERLIVCTATSYGASLINKHENIKSVTGKPLDQAQIKTLIEREKIEKVIDLTHPYALEISANIRAACHALDVPLERYTRDSYFKEDADVTFADNYVHAAEILSKTQGNIMLTIGSRRLKPFADMIPRSRMIIRVLPTSEAMTACEALGFFPNQIIGAKGPFSAAFNRNIYEDFSIKYLVTKDSGKQGGLETKIIPALEMGINIIVIKRPEED